MIAAVTGISPDEGPTAGSLSIQHSGAALRVACAEARAIYLGVAAARWDMYSWKLETLPASLRARLGLWNG